MTYSTIAPTDGPPPDRAGACEDILGYRVTTISKDACLRQILGWIESGAKGRYLACLNPHSIEIARRDAAFAAALHDADLAVPDGVGMLIASRILGGRIRQRITGSDIFWGLNGLLNRRGGCSVFFWGPRRKRLRA